MWIIKIGGSLQYSEQLPIWLKLFSRSTPNQFVIVPGGGKFADEVRSAQSHWRFNDATAHRMALLAMHQFGVMLSAFDPVFKPTMSVEKLFDEVRQNKIPIWLPEIDTLNQAGIASSWKITSDSLSAWLALNTNAEKLILIKSISPPHDLSLAQLSNINIVDKGFPEFIANAPFMTYIYGPGDQQSFVDIQFETETGILQSEVAQ